MMRGRALGGIRSLLMRVGVSRGGWAFIGLALASTLGACASKKASVYQPTDRPEEIRKVVEAHLPEVKQCFEAELEKAPRLEGQIKLSWTFDDTGKVIDVVNKRVDPGLSPVAECTKLRLKGWRFPPAAKGDFVTVDFPFLFSN